jgi:hypothetical protein
MARLVLALAGFGLDHALAGRRLANRFHKKSDSLIAVQHLAQVQCIVVTPPGQGVVDLC